MWDRGSYCRRAKGKGTSYRGSAPSLPASTPPEHVPVQGRSHFTIVARFLISLNSLGATTDLHHLTTAAAHFKTLKTFELANPSLNRVRQFFGIHWREFLEIDQQHDA